MVGAGSLPAWAVLVIETARLLIDRGWLGTQLEPGAGQLYEVVERQACAECPACSPVLSCPEAVWWPSAAVLVLTALLGAAAGGFCCRHGSSPTRAAPRRRGGGVVA